MEQWLYWTRIFCILLSLALTGLMLERYLVKREYHLLIWMVAWLTVAGRVTWETFLPKKLGFNFINDFLTITHDLLWFIGLVILLEGTSLLKFIFPFTYLALHSLLSAIFYFGLKSNILGAIESSIFTHPILLFILSWYFYLCFKALKSLGAKIISFSYLLWALDYIIFGVPYFGMGMQLAGVLGWSIGLIFRISIFIGFLILIREEQPS